MSRPGNGIPRRGFVRKAVAVGGLSALAACLEWDGSSSGQALDAPQGTTDPSDFPERQHAWDESLDTDEHGNVIPPEHHVFLGLEYVGNGPTDGERNTLESAFETLERAFEQSNEGILSTVGYGPRYFDRFDGELPNDVSLPEPEPLTGFENPTLDSFDALIHLASDSGAVVLSAEEALTGSLDSVNEVQVEGTINPVFDVVDRRTGFVGDGLPAEKQSGLAGIPDSNPVPEDAPFFMGFKSGFARNQATEDRVTIEDGPFADGTTAHLSRIRLHLEQWYDQDSRAQRVAKMFCPAHAAEDRVEGAGHNLGNASQIDDCIDDAETDARTRGVVGHAQKAARAREDGAPIILRRDVNSTDGEAASVHFLSLQRTIDDFVRTREAMTGTDLAAGSVGTRTNNGILQYISVRGRANYLVPPRRHRTLPSPDPS